MDSNWYGIGTGYTAPCGRTRVAGGQNSPLIHELTEGFVRELEDDFALNGKVHTHIGCRHDEKRKNTWQSERCGQ